MIPYFAKLAYISGLTKDMTPDGIMLRSRNKIKRQILWCVSPLFFVIGFLVKTYAHLRALCLERKNSYKFNLAVVLIIKNEGDYIEEWLSFHRVIGIDHVFLYDNESEDNTKELVQPYIDSGFVTYKLFKGIGIQYAAYNDALKEYGHLCKYMAYFDADEFLLPKKTSLRVADLVEQAFQQDKNIGAIGINMWIYGSSGHLTKTPGLVIERFTYRGTKDCVTNIHIKTIVKPICIRLFNHPHYAQLLKGYYTTGLHGELIGSWYHPVNEDDNLRLNHYITKSKEESDKRSAIHRVANGKYKPTDQFERYDKNDVKDTIALDYLQEVKEDLRRSSSLPPFGNDSFAAKEIWRSCVW